MNFDLPFVTREAAGHLEIVFCLCLASLVTGRLLGPVVKASAWRATDMGSVPAVAVDLIPGGVIPVT